MITNTEQIREPSRRHADYRQMHKIFLYTIGESVALLVARWTNNRRVVGSRPAEVVCITVLTGNRLG